MAEPGPTQLPEPLPEPLPEQRAHPRSGRSGVPPGSALGRRRLAAARVGRLATTTPTGRPHIVPCCFVLSGDTVYSAVDAKPKSSALLRRLDNVRANPAVSLLVDHYDENWSELWWVRVDGWAQVLHPGEATDRALAMLGEKYPQYGSVALTGPVISVLVTAWREWP
ncbi:MAG TPA: TIGR03668 family PPOX class F420-dependent oxidoreductase [Acidimicrobiales bacterium]|nr:TIGR03668 family PPOX class F420-dependent oxidoreductase [Acidimicrobiales bacterium]